MKKAGPIREKVVDVEGHGGITPLSYRPLFREISLAIPSPSRYTIPVPAKPATEVEREGFPMKGTE